MNIHLATDRFVTGWLYTRRIGRGGSTASDKEHILKLDHRYGPHNTSVYGTTLCGKVGRITSTGDYDLERVFERFTYRRDDRTIPPLYACQICAKSAARNLET